MGFDYLRPPIGEAIFNKSGIINEVWNKFFNELIGIEQFKELEGIVANHVLVGYDISSTDYVAGTSGWRIASDSGSGVAEFNIPIISYEQLTGTIAAAVGGVGAAGLTGETSGDTAVRFWAGSTFANRATAPFRVLQNGAVTMTSATITGGSIDSTSTINGTASSTVVTNAANGATFTSSNAGSLAYLNAVGTSQIDTTVISGGKIVTGLLTASNITTGTLNCNNVSLSGNLSSAVSGGYYNLTTGNLYFASSGLIYFTTSGPNIWGNSGQVRIEASASISIGVTTSGITFETSSGNRIDYNTGNLRPQYTNAASLGGTSNRWNEIHCTAFWAGGTQRYDTLDDLDVLHAIKTLPDGKIDLRSLPKKFNYLDEAKAKIKEQNFDMLTDDEITEMIADDSEDMTGFLALNVAEYTSLIEGAVRQLDKETSDLFQQTNDWVNDIEKRLKKIEKEKSNA